MEEQEAFMPKGRSVSDAWSVRHGAEARPAADLAACCPRLLKAYLFSQTRRAGFRLEDRPVIDYEIEFILESSGKQVIDDVSYEIHPGDIVFRPPGSRTQGIMPYRCMTLIFNLEGRPLARPEHYFDAWTHPSPAWPCQARFRNPLIEKIPPTFHPSGGDALRSLFETCLKHWVSPGQGSELLQKACLLQILYQILAALADPLPEGAAGDKSGTQRRLQAVLAYLRKHYRRALPLAELAEVAGLSPSHLHKLFTEALGETPLDYARRLRLDAARELLATSELSASAVARECGFENVPYFFTEFRRSSGLTPAAFRARHRYVP